MITTFELNANELDTRFIKAIKTLFGDRKIKVTVDVEMDETEYLLRSEANRKALLESIKQTKNGEFVRINLDELQ